MEGAIRASPVLLLVFLPSTHFGRDAVQLTESFSIRIEDVGKSGVRNKNHITQPTDIAVGSQVCVCRHQQQQHGHQREQNSLYCLVFHSHLISNFFLSSSQFMKILPPTHRRHIHPPTPSTLPPSLSATEHAMMLNAVLCLVGYYCRSAVDRFQAKSMEPYRLMKEPTTTTNLWS